VKCGNVDEQLTRRLVRQVVVSAPVRGRWPRRLVMSTGSSKPIPTWP